MLVFLSLGIAYLFVVFILQVVYKCGLEAWLEKHNWNEDPLIFAAIVFWPLTLVIVPCGIIVHFFIKSFSWAVDATVRTICPNRK